MNASEIIRETSCLLRQDYDFKVMAKVISFYRTK